MAPLGLDSMGMKAIILKARIEHKYLIYSSEIPLFSSGKQRPLSVLLYSQFFQGWSKLKCYMHLLRERCNLFCWLFCGIDLTKDVCQVGGWVGGPIQDDFPGHIYPSISEKSFSGSFLIMEKKAEQKGRWHAKWKAKNNKQYMSCLDLGFNVVAICVWKLINSYNNIWLFFFLEGCLCSGKAIMKLLFYFNLI